MIVADDLIEGIKTYCMMPTSQNTLTPDDILGIVDGVIRSKIVPMLESVDEDFFVTTLDVPLVPSVSEYDIPSRAIGRALRDLKIKNSTGTLTTRSLAKIAIEDVHLYIGTNDVYGFYFKGDRIALVDYVPSTLPVDEALEVWYRLPPNKLVLSADAARVVSVTPTEVTVESVPSTWAIGNTVDFIQGPSGSRLLSIDQSLIGVTTTTLTFDVDVIPTTLAADDYIALSGTSPVLNFVPNEAQTLIELRAAQRCLRSIGDFEGARELNEDISDATKEFLKLVSPRVDGEPTVIINRQGLVRGNRWNLQRRWTTRV